MAKKAAFVIVALLLLAFLAVDFLQTRALRNSIQEARAAAAAATGRAEALETQLVASRKEAVALQAQLTSRRDEIAALQNKVADLERQSKQRLLAAPVDIPLPGVQLPLPNLDPNGDIGAFLEAFGPDVRIALDQALNQIAPPVNGQPQNGNVRVIVNGVDVGAGNAAGQQPNQPGAPNERRIQFPGGRMQIRILGADNQPAPPPKAPPEKDPGNF
ncbi:MAG: hypothetical protein NTW87_23620 [Planctomycetota bacterium]|nr:hypothetical protein [Planctomycetota bacterium]